MVLQSSIRCLPENWHSTVFMSVQECTYELRRMFVTFSFLCQFCCETLYLLLKISGPTEISGTLEDISRFGCRKFTCNFSVSLTARTSCRTITKFELMNVPKNNLEQTSETYRWRRTRRRVLVLIPKYQLYYCKINENSVKLF